MSEVVIDLISFVLAAAAIWWAGGRLELRADAIARRTGLGHAFTGVLLLAVVTSLPEVVTTVTAIVVHDDPTLAVYGLLGGVAMQTAVLALADARKGRSGALTYFSPRFALLLQAVGVVLLLQLAIVGIVAKGVPTVASVSVWSIALAAAYGALLYLAYRFRKRGAWVAADRAGAANEGDDEGAEEGEGASTLAKRSRARLGVESAALAGVVLAGGLVATNSAESLAELTGLGSAFIGATLLASATSLPEVSTTLAGVRGGRYTEAISNVFGGNAFDVTLILLADVLYRDGAVLASTPLSAVLVAAIGSAMTCVYLWGLLERENHTIAGIGWDSATALLLLVAGLSALYFVQ
jgi:cation:H+ antiporter